MSNLVTANSTAVTAANINKFVATALTAGTAGVCLAAARILGTNTTPTASNITGFSTSVTDNGTGDYSVTYANTFSATPTVQLTAAAAAGGFACASVSAESSAGCTIKVRSHDGSAVDATVDVLVVGSRA